VEALSLLEQAVALDPDYPAAQAMLSRLLIQFYVQPYDEHRGDEDLVDRAVAAGKRSVALDPDYSTAHAMYGSALMWAGRYEDSLSELRMAVSLNPNDVDSVALLSDALARAGYHEEALQYAARAEEMDPHLPPLHYGLTGRTRIFLDQFDQAVEDTGRCIDRVPRLFACLIFHAAALSGAGRTDEAKATALRMMDINPGFTITRYLQIVNYARPQDRAKLKTLLLTAGLPE